MLARSEELRRRHKAARLLDILARDLAEVVARYSVSMQVLPLRARCSPSKIRPAARCIGCERTQRSRRSPAPCVAGARWRACCARSAAAGAGGGLEGEHVIGFWPSKSPAHTHTHVVADVTPPRRRRSWRVSCGLVVGQCAAEQLVVAEFGRAQARRAHAFQGGTASTLFSHVLTGSWAFDAKSHESLAGVAHGEPWPNSVVPQRIGRAGHRGAGVHRGGSDEHQRLRSTRKCLL